MLSFNNDHHWLEAEKQIVSVFQLDADWTNLQPHRCQVQDDSVHWGKTWDFYFLGQSGEEVVHVAPFTFFLFCCSCVTPPPVCKHPAPSARSWGVTLAKDTPLSFFRPRDWLYTYIRHWWRLSRHRLESELLMEAISWSLSHSQLCSCSHTPLCVSVSAPPQKWEA